MKLLIDSNAICHQAKFSVGNLDYESQATGVIFGFLRQLLKLSQLYPNSDFIFCWDSKTSLRKKIYPEYKANRKKEKSPEEEEFDRISYAQFDLIKTDILPKIGYRNIFEYEGYESDDIFASITHHYLNDNIVIVTSDEDIYQLLFPDVSIYSPSKKAEYKFEHFVKEFDIDPDDWVNVKAIAGCASDGVKGIEGVGEKTAIKYLKGALSTDSRLYKKIVSDESRRIIRRNIKLVRLPYSNTPIPEIVSDELSLNNFMSVCQRYGFNSILQPKELNKWEECLRLG